MGIPNTYVEGRLFDDLIPHGGDFEKILRLLAANYGVQHAAYLAIELPQLVQPEPYFVSTYPSAWIEHYRRARFVEYDPVLHEAAGAVMPSNWRSLNRRSGLAKQLFRDAAAAGIGDQGVTIPIRGPNGETAMFSLAGFATDETWDALLKQHLGAMQLHAHYFHNLVMDAHGIVNQTRLSRRELEVVAWLCAGKTQEDIAEILNLSLHTVNTYVRSTKFKLNALNTAHLVAKAIRMKLVRPRD